uniref:olfactory receptor 8K3-like n=1 Tax=Panthera onca TaxID=9690 RepID=UPI002954152D|nr:olfactory receptor 8K3-like [Panthera onca]
MAVTVFYGTLLFMYLQPRSNHSLDTDKMASVFYTLVIPMLNPLIYSLRNKDVKDALKSFLNKACESGYNSATSLLLTARRLRSRQPGAQEEKQDLEVIPQPLSQDMCQGFVTSAIGKMLQNIDLRLGAYICIREHPGTHVHPPGPGTALEFLLSSNKSQNESHCSPHILYMVVMSQKVCWVLVAVPYVYSAFLSLIITIKIFMSSFCDHNVIRHFYCDNLPLLTLLCSSTRDIELIILIFSAFNLVSSLLIVLVSYILILMAILSMNSAQGRHKAFSTCGSHMTVVIVLYATLFFMYVQPKSSHSFDTDKIASVFYTLIIPMLNPMIYSLRNKEVKGALRRIWKNLHKLPM